MNRFTIGVVAWLLAGSYGCAAIIYGTDNSFNGKPQATVLIGAMIARTAQRDRLRLAVKQAAIEFCQTPKMA